MDPLSLSFVGTLELLVINFFMSDFIILPRGPVPETLFKSILFSVAILFAISLFLLMPMINNARDQKKESKFKYLHAASVIINFLQIFILLYVLL